MEFMTFEYEIHEFVYKNWYDKALFIVPILAFRNDVDTVLVKY